MAKIKIASLEQFLIHAGKVSSSKASWDDVQLLPRSIVVPVVTTGKGWDKRIDSRGARFIQNYQKLVDNIYTNYPQMLSSPKRLVKVEAKEGSSGLDFDLTKIFSDFISKCPAEDIPMVIYALIGSGFCLASLFLYYRNKQNTQDKALIEKALSANSETVALAFSAISNMRPPLTAYVSSLSDQDTVSVAGTEPLYASEARKILRKKRTKLVTRYVSCDGHYLLMGLVLKQFPPALIIKQGEETITAQLERLDEATRKALIVQVEQGISQKTLPKTIGLQIDVYFNNKDIKYATIIAIGNPRDDRSHYPLEDVPSRVLFKDTMTAL